MTPACAGLDPIFDHAADNPNDPAAQDAARAICHTCPLVDPCLDVAMRHERSLSTANRYGVWGGLDARERGALWRAGRAERSTA